MDHKSRLDAIIVIWQKAGLLQEVFTDADLPDAHVAFSVPGDAARAVIELRSIDRRLFALEESQLFQLD